MRVSQLLSFACAWSAFLIFASLSDVRAGIYDQCKQEANVEWNAYQGRKLHCRALGTLSRECSIRNGHFKCSKQIGKYLGCNSSSHYRKYNRAFNSCRQEIQKKRRKLREEKRKSERFALKTKKSSNSLKVLERVRAVLDKVEKYANPFLKKQVNANEKLKAIKEMSLDAAQLRLGQLGFAGELSVDLSDIAMGAAIDSSVGAMTKLFSDMKKFDKQMLRAYNKYNTKLDKKFTSLAAKVGNADLEALYDNRRQKQIERQEESERRQRRIQRKKRRQATRAQEQAQLQAIRRQLIIACYQSGACVDYSGSVGTSKYKSRSGSGKRGPCNGGPGHCDVVDSKASGRIVAPRGTNTSPRRQIRKPFSPADQYNPFLEKRTTGGSNPFLKK